MASWIGPSNPHLQQRSFLKDSCPSVSLMKLSIFVNSPTRSSFFRQGDEISGHVEIRAHRFKCPPRVSVTLRGRLKVYVALKAGIDLDICPGWVVRTLFNETRELDRPTSVLQDNAEYVCLVPFTFVVPTCASDCAIPAIRDIPCELPPSLKTAASGITIKAEYDVIATLKHGRPCRMPRTARRELLLGSTVCLTALPSCGIGFLPASKLVQQPAPITPAPGHVPPGPVPEYASAAPNTTGIDWLPEYSPAVRLEMLLPEPPILTKGHATPLQLALHVPPEFLRGHGALAPHPYGGGGSPGERHPAPRSGFYVHSVMVQLRQTTSVQLGLIHRRAVETQHLWSVRGLVPVDKERFPIDLGSWKISLIRDVNPTFRSGTVTISHTLEVLAGLSIGLQAQMEELISNDLERHLLHVDRQEQECACLLSLSSLTAPLARQASHTAASQRSITMSEVKSAAAYTTTVENGGPFLVHTPLWVTIVRGFQVFLSFVIIILAGLLIHGLAMDANVFALVCGLFTFIIVGYALITEKAPTCQSAYNIWAVLGLDLLMAIFWLSSMAANAALRAAFVVHVAADCYDDGSTVNAGHCTVYRRAALDRRTPVVTQTGAAEISAIAGLSALNMLLFIASLVYNGHAFRMHYQQRKASGGAGAAESGAGGGFTTGAQQFPQYTEQQQYHSQAYAQPQVPVEQQQQEQQQQQQPYDHTYYDQHYGQAHPQQYQQPPQQQVYQEPEQQLQGYSAPYGHEVPDAYHQQQAYDPHGTPAPHYPPSQPAAPQ
ncbi:hypothetical protein VTK73DRAFT_3101 [Phialemonium thermophilum]|uniref:MARVEL domain-containing protein n=1 Tax=Phialemonium thermophilum TaxID=223376 RepID=A0ABR3X178_9PEZI